MLVPNMQSPDSPHKFCLSRIVHKICGMWGQTRKKYAIYAIYMRNIGAKPRKICDICAKYAIYALSEAICDICAKYAIYAQNMRSAYFPPLHSSG